ncbi:putative nucleoprotein [Apple rootstock virus A]|uniref:Nucleoprotein n=1 Tax=Apple rootstock virus A TaxID=2563012 RepID=A0A4D6DD54_9RHAB|nr:putative nucleoprotein [Apple rootstock virus A]QBZ28532.1 putative nucleoprotein [Apple rootstock virus A]
MSDISFSDLIAVSDKFKSIPQGRKPEKPSGQSSNVPYKFEDAFKSPMYKVKALSSTEIVTIFNKAFVSEVVEMNEEDFLNTVVLALNIKDPLDNTKILTIEKPWPEFTKCADFESAVPSKTSKVSFAGTKGSNLVETVVRIPSSTNQMETDSTELEGDKVTAICFIAAWVSRYAVKSPGDQLSLQLAALETTYLKMYGRSSTVFKSFSPTKEYLMALQNCYQSFPRVRNTLAINVGYMECYYKTMPKQFNLLRYCFFQHLEFMGMHAYTSAVQIINKLSLPVGLVLTWLRMSGMEDAVDEIGHIIGKFDNGMLTNGNSHERLWKYARILNDGYFNKMQTSYNPELIATLAWIEIKLGLSVEGGYNSPLNIQVIKGNEALSEVGKAKAEAFLECKNSVVAGQAGASVVDRMYARRFSSTFSQMGKRQAEHVEEEPRPRKKPMFDLGDIPEL